MRHATVMKRPISGVRADPPDRLDDVIVKLRRILMVDGFVVKNPVPKPADFVHPSVDALPRHPFPVLAKDAREVTAPKVGVVFAAHDHHPEAKVQLRDHGAGRWRTTGAGQIENRLVDFRDGVLAEGRAAIPVPSGTEGRGQLSAEVVAKTYF